MRAPGRVVVVAMLLLSSVTASFAGDRTTKAMTTAQDGKAAADGSSANFAFDWESGRLHVGDTADLSGGDTAPPRSESLRPRAADSESTRDGGNRVKTLAFLILMLKQDRGAR
jgi:hypothetical protein